MHTPIQGIEHFSALPWFQWSIEIKIIQKINNRLTRKFKWYANVERYHIKRTNAFVDCYEWPDIHSNPTTSTSLTSSDAGLGTGCNWKEDIVSGTIVDIQRPVLSQS